MSICALRNWPFLPWSSQKFIYLIDHALRQPTVLTAHFQFCLSLVMCVKTADPIFFLHYLPTGIHNMREKVFGISMLFKDMLNLFFCKEKRQDCISQTVTHHS